jgi:hypothetical protein
MHSTNKSFPGVSTEFVVVEGKEDPGMFRVGIDYVIYFHISRSSSGSSSSKSSAESGIYVISPPKFELVLLSN